MNTQGRQSEVNIYLSKMLTEGLIPYCEMGPVMSYRRQIQDNPLVVNALAIRLKELKKVYEHYCVNNYFKFETSALKLFEMEGM